MFPDSIWIFIEPINKNRFFFTKAKSQMEKQRKGLGLLGMEHPNLT